jgi:hypothetical protein
MAFGEHAGSRRFSSFGFELAKTQSADLSQGVVSLRPQSLCQYRIEPKPPKNPRHPMPLVHIRLDQNLAVAYKESYASGLRVRSVEDGSPTGSRVSRAEWHIRPGLRRHR